MITFAMVEAGYKCAYPVIRLVLSPNKDNVYCEIGKSKFLFGGMAAHGVTPEAYKQYVPEDEIIREIYDTLETFRKAPEWAETYAYYESVLNEHGIREEPRLVNPTRRTILFRGQTRRKGEKVRMDGTPNGTPLPGNWVYGGVMSGNGDRSIIYGSISGENENITVAIVDKYTVWADTVCEFTGCVDINKTKIFERDIIRSKYDSRLMVVRFLHGAFYATDAKTSVDILLGNVCGGCEVIGNEIDDPDLLLPDNDLDYDGYADFMAAARLDAKNKKSSDESTKQEDTSK